MGIISPNIDLQRSFDIELFKMLLSLGCIKTRGWALVPGLFTKIFWIWELPPVPKLWVKLIKYECTVRLAHE